MSLPLEGVRVIDWTQWQQGPVAAMMLGDLGADVIKVEEPLDGDPGRGVVVARSDRSSYFENNNRNKRGITLNLKTEKGKSILYQLVAISDVFLLNFLPRVANRLGLDYETLCAHNSRLIYAVASGFGPKGPDADRPSFDGAGLARSGLMMMLGEQGMPPLKIDGGFADQSGATLLAYGVVAALFARERSGIGQRVDSSLLGSMMWLQGMGIGQKLLDVQPPCRLPRSRVPNPLYNYYLCRGGRWLILAHVQSDRYWPHVCRALGIEHLRDDPRYVDSRARGENNLSLIAMLDELFATKTREEWLALLDAQDCISTVVNDYDDLVADPVASANDYIVSYEHPAWGPMRGIGFPATFSETPCAVRRSAPVLGQHTEEILRGLLGYERDEVVKLHEAGVI